MVQVELWQESAKYGPYCQGQARSLSDDNGQPSASYTGRSSFQCGISLALQWFTSPPSLWLLSKRPLSRWAVKAPSNGRCCPSQSRTCLAYKSIENDSHRLTQSCKFGFLLNSASAERKGVGSRSCRQTQIRYRHATYRLPVTRHSLSTVAAL
jgi:hypothetical protein